MSDEVPRSAAGERSAGKPRVSLDKGAAQAAPDTEGAPLPAPVAGPERASGQDRRTRASAPAPTPWASPAPTNAPSAPTPPTPPTPEPNPLTPLSPNAAPQGDPFAPPAPAPQGDTAAPRSNSPAPQPNPFAPPAPAPAPHGGPFTLPAPAPFPPQPYPYAPHGSPDARPGAVENVPPPPIAPGGPGQVPYGYPGTGPAYGYPGTGPAYGYPGHPSAPYGAGQPWPGTQPEPGNGMGTASLVLGIIAAAGFLLWPVALILGVLAVIFGAVGRSKARHGEATNPGVALAGIICGAAGFVLAAGVLVLAFATYT
ncbi:DUF4190 domain-containing protein [Streptomyces sp. NPDC100445]|uniref:DUF4190 domain-containing protein n=1 Tax=Streptomyces sp. NPDC100445 TaxID=3366102 RepID=UPI003808303C